MTDSELATRNVTGADLDVESERYRAYKLALAKLVQDAARAETPKSTRLAFAQDWALWSAFIADQNSQHRVTLDVVRDADADQLVAFVKWLDRVKRASPTSMPRRLTGVRGYLAAEHGKTLTADDLAPARKAVRNMLAASGGDDEQQQKQDRAERASRARGQADLVTRDDVRLMVRSAPDTMLGARDKTLAALSFAVAARVAETSAMAAANIRVVDGGLEVDVPAVKGTKGRTVAVPYASADNADICPVRLWKAWSTLIDADGPAFPRFNRGGRPMGAFLSAESYRNALNALGVAADLPQNVTGHSFRRGYITQARLDGVPVERIAAQSGHSMKSPEFWKYIDLADKWSQARAVN